jgi:glyoxylate/hydroxypyruvate reductase
MAILFCSSLDPAGRWREALARELPHLETRIYPDIGDPGTIDYALVWAPPPGLLAALPRLKLIASIGAGVDHILADPSVPRHVPIVRLVDPATTRLMSEYVLAQTLRLHRQDLLYEAQQRAGIWQWHEQPDPAERRVGILGLGRLGTDAATRLKANGFDIAGWSRTGKTLDGIACFSGGEGFDALLRRSDILICLLPLTAATENILDRRAFDHLPRGASVVNVARGRHLVDADLLEALDSGQLAYAILDVFREEPLPPDHPFWRHSRIVVTPHVAGAAEVRTAAPIIADAIRRAEAGLPLRDVVDPERGY